MNNVALGALPLIFPFQSIEASTVLPFTADTLWQAWNWDIPVIIALMFSLWLYNRGLIILWRRLGFGRGVTYWQVGAFIGALLVIAAALISPLEALSHVLFSAHMAQHMLLIIVVAPLLAVSGFQNAFLAALPRTWQSGLGRRWRNSRWLHSLWHFMTRPVATWIIGISVIWLWHLPTLYQLALQNDAVHSAEHLLFLFASMLFWWTLLKPAQQKYISYGAHVIYLFLATLQGTALGALFIFSSVPWYQAYVSTAPLWKFTALQDQQLAGIIMWLPAGLLYLAADLLFFIYWLKALDTRMGQVHHEYVELAGRK